MTNSVSSRDLISLYEGEDYTGRYHDEAGERISRILAQVKFSKSDKVLDVGCGNGLLLPELANKINKLDGVDFSKAFINEANKRAEKLKIPKNKYHYSQADVIKFCQSHKGYDKVFALDFTEHINDDEFLKIFSAIKKSMKPKATLLIHTPNKDFIIERLKSDRQKVEVQGHIGLRNANEYRDLFKRLGYKNIKITPINHYVSVLKPLHFFSKLPIKRFASLFEARLVIKCEA